MNEQFLEARWRHKRFCSRLLRDNDRGLFRGEGYHEPLKTSRRIFTVAKVRRIVREGRWMDLEQILRSDTETDQLRVPKAGTILHEAALLQDEPLFTTLFDHAPDDSLLLTDCFGQTILHALSLSHFSTETLKTVISRLPLEAHFQRSSRGELPLHSFFRRVQKQEVKATLENALLVMDCTPLELLAARTASRANIMHYFAHCVAVDKVESIISSVGTTVLLEQDSSGFTPLHRALAVGQGCMAEALLHMTPDSALVMDCELGECPVETLLYRHLPYKWSASDDLARLVKCPSDSGLFNASRWEATTPLHLACLTKNDTLISAVVKGATTAQVSEWASKTDEQSGITPLQFLMKFAAMSAMSELLLPFVDTPTLLIPYPGTEETLLHSSAAQFSQSLMDALLERLPSSSVHSRDCLGCSPLLNCLNGIPGRLFALLRASDSDCPLTLNDWRELRTDVEFPLPALVDTVERYPKEFFFESSPADWQGCMTPLHAVCGVSLFPHLEFETPCIRVLSAIVSCVPSWMLTVKNRRGHNPIHRALMCGCTLAVEAFLNMGKEALDAAEDPVGLIGPRPLEIAISRGDVQSVKVLVTKARSGIVWIPTTTGSTPLEFAETSAPPHTRDALRSAIQRTPKSAVG